MSRPLLVFIVTVIVLTAAAPTGPIAFSRPAVADEGARQGDGVIPIPDMAGAILLPDERAELMRAKLTASADALGGLVNGDFTEVARAADVLGRIAETTPRRYADVREMAYTEHFRAEFIRQSNELRDLAKARNL